MAKGRPHASPAKLRGHIRPLLIDDKRENHTRNVIVSYVMAGLAGVRTVMTGRGSCSDMIRSSHIVYFSLLVNCLYGDVTAP